MQHGPHLNPFQRFLRSILLTMFSIAQPIESTVTWFLTGTAAITALLIGNIESITKLVDLSWLKGGLVCLVISMVAGVFARATGISIGARIAMINQLYEYFNSPEAQKDMAGMAEMKVEPSEINQQLESFFSFPVNLAIRRGGSQGNDPLSTEKSCAKSFSKLVLLVILQQAFALVGLLLVLVGL